MPNSNCAYQALIAIYQDPEIKNNAQDVHHTLGFICAVAASPVSLTLPDWLPRLWKEDQAPSFSNETLAVDFASAVLQFYDDCARHYQQSQPVPLPQAAWLSETEQITVQGQAFASGYLLAFDSLEPYWQALQLAPGSEPEQVLQTTMLLLSKMAMPNSDDSEMQTLFTQLPDISEIVAVLPQLLARLGYCSSQVDVR